MSLFKHLLILRRLCTFKEHIKTPILVPAKPYKSKIDLNKLPEKTRIDAATIELLERLSLVDCANKESIATLEAAIEFADQIQQVDTTDVYPLVTVLEDMPLRLRDDDVKGQCSKDEIFKNAAVVEEDYFVTPPGNIPLETREDLLFQKESKELLEKQN